MIEGVLIAVGALFLAVALWVWACAPARGRRRARAWAGTAFAHRGLHGDGCPENSLPAFERACEVGCGIELDVLATRDGHLVVFHDDDALRMTGAKGLIRAMTLGEVRTLRLDGGACGIPTLDEVLEAVGGRVPLLIEIKVVPRAGELARMVAGRMRRYEGRYLIQSFDPMCLWWLRKHAPEIIRGQLIKGYAPFRKTLSAGASILLSGAFMNAFSRPDFVAYAREMRRDPAIWLHRRVFRTPLAVWTVTDPGEMRELIARGEMPIFEQNGGTGDD